MNVVELLEKVKIAMENKDYDMVPTLKNRNSKRIEIVREKNYLFLKKR